QFDAIVRLGDVPLGPVSSNGSLLGTPLFRNIKLADYAAAEFIGVFDFDDIAIDAAAVSTRFGATIPDAATFEEPVDGEPVSRVRLRNLVGLRLPGVTLEALIRNSFVSADDLTDPTIGLDIRDLEESELFRDGDLRNFVTVHEVHLRDMVASVNLV